MLYPGSVVPLAMFKCLLKELGSDQGQSHWLHFFDFSPLCIFKCFLKQSGSGHSHIGSICFTFLHCAFSNVSSNCLSEKMHSCIGLIFSLIFCVYQGSIFIFISLKSITTNLDCCHLRTVSFKMRIAERRDNRTVAKTARSSPSKPDQGRQ